MYRPCANDASMTLRSGVRLAPAQAQRFMATVLLPHVRQDIRANRRLHFALFQALKKATYKPDAFYKARTGHSVWLAVCQGLFWAN